VEACSAAAARRQPRLESGRAKTGSARTAAQTGRGHTRRRRWRIVTMIAHVILFKPKPEMAAGDRQAVLEALATAAIDIPAIRRMRVGRRVTHGRPGYEQAMREDYEFTVIIEFDDLDGLTSYLAHPRHAAVGSYFAESAAAALAYDYEVIDLKPAS
jgi:Stress responsive A/B Barrel Domain